MTWSLYGSYLVVVVLIVVAPGPDTMVMLKNALAGGWRGGLNATCGIVLGSMLQGTASAFGLGVVIARSQPVFAAVKWLGAAYLGWLGLQSLWAAVRGSYPGDAGIRETPLASGFRRWREGLLSNVTNPKVLVLYLSVLPQFLPPGTTTILDALVYAYTVAVLGGLWLLLLLLFVQRVRAWLGRRKVRRGLDGCTGAALVGFGVALVMEN